MLTLGLVDLRWSLAYWVEGGGHIGSKVVGVCRSLAAQPTVCYIVLLFIIEVYGSGMASEMKF